MTDMTDCLVSSLYACALARALRAMRAKRGKTHLSDTSVTRGAG